MRQFNRQRSYVTRGKKAEPEARYIKGLPNNSKTLTAMRHLYIGCMSVVQCV